MFCAKHKNCCSMGVITHDVIVLDDDVFLLYCFIKLKL